MNTYVKMTLQSFLERLKEGKYQGVAGARRAVGKSELSDEEKKKANKVIDRHFSSSDEAATSSSPAPAQKVVKVIREKKNEPVEEEKDLRSTHRTVQVTKDALEGLARAKTADAGVNVSDAAQVGVNILGKALHKIHQALGGKPKPHLNGSAKLRHEPEMSEGDRLDAQD